MVNDIFQKMLGRDATPQEYDYLQKFIKEGNLQPGEIGTLLQGHPEYQNRQLQQNLGQYSQTLQANDQNILQQGADRAGAQATSRFAGLGRPNSSAMAAQVFGQTGQIAQGLAQSRQSALASFYGQGMQANAAMAGQQGQDTLGRAYGQQNAKQQREWDLADYNRQQNDYNNAMNAKSGWNAITPEFATSQLFGLGGKLAGGYVGGMAGKSVANGGWGS